MATENIITGKKYRTMVDAANKIWQRISFWTKASDVEFNDGGSAEEKVGVIDGITSDVNGESDTIAASIKAVNEVNNNLNNSLSGYSFGYTDDGKPGYREPGADTVNPFKIGCAEMGEFAARTTDGLTTLSFQNTYDPATMFFLVRITPRVEPNTVISEVYWQYDSTGRINGVLLRNFISGLSSQTVKWYIFTEEPTT